jgi:hypothetical protein
MNSTRDVHRSTAPLPVGEGAGGCKTKSNTKKLKISGFWLFKTGTDDYSPMQILWVIVRGCLKRLMRVYKSLSGLILDSKKAQIYAIFPSEYQL